MGMDSDFDFSFAPSETIYGARAVRLDPVNIKQCYLGTLNSMCVGLTPQQSEFAPGLTGNSTTPYILAQVGDNSNVPAYGPGRKGLIDVDPNWVGQIVPNDLIISSNSGYARRASPLGPWNQWIVGISLAIANPGQSCNELVVIFPWSPTGS